jgi:hypothetical protein
VTTSTSDQARSSEPFDPEPRSFEPTDVGPIAASDPTSAYGGGLRASDADRSQVTTLLSTAYAEGRLTREEHEQRLEQVLRARTFDELVPLTADLVPTTAGPAPAVGPDPHTYDIAPGTGSEPTEKMVAVFGGVQRRGRWRVRRQTQALAVFGGMDLDLREAIFEAPVVEISGFWCFGGLDIKVPAGMEVIDHTAGIFGGTEVKDLGPRDPSAPTLVIKGMTLFGGVSVKGPRPTRQERRDRRQRGCH